MKRKGTRPKQVAIKFIEENDQWANLSFKVKEEITDLTSRLFVDWIKQMTGTAKGTLNG